MEHLRKQTSLTSPAPADLLREDTGTGGFVVSEGGAAVQGEPADRG